MSTINKIIAEVEVRGAQALDKLQQTFKGVAQVSNKAEDALQDVEKRLKRTGAAAKKAAPQLEDLGSKFAKVGGAGGALGGALESLAVGMSGPLGLAVAGATLAVGGLAIAFKTVQVAANVTADSVAEYIGSNDLLKKRTEETSGALRDLKIAFGEAVVGGENFETVLKTIGKEFKKFTTRLKTNSGEVLQRAQMIAEVVTRVAQGASVVIGALLAGLLLPFDVAATQFFKLKKRILEDFEIMLSVVQPMLVATGIATADQVATWMSTISKARRSTPNYFLEITKAIKDANVELAIFMGAINSAFQNISGVRGPAASPAPALERMSAKQLEEHYKQEKKREEAAKRKSGAGKAKPPKIPSKGWGAEGFKLPPLSMPAASGDAGGMAGFGGAGGTIGTDIAALEDLATAYDGAAASSITFWSQARNIGVQALDIVTDGLYDMAGAVAKTMGEFRGGVGTLSEFGDKILDMFGEMAGQLGQFFFLEGMGMMFTPGGQVAGAGLIAAGLGLQALGGYLGAKGSGNRGTGAGAAAGASADTVTRDLQRSLRAPGGAGGQQTIIEVVIAGRSIEPEMVSILDEVSRLQRSRSAAAMR